MKNSSPFINSNSQIHQKFYQFLARKKKRVGVRVHVAAAGINGGLSVKFKIYYHYEKHACIFVRRIQMDASEWSLSFYYTPLSENAPPARL
jgi:hypothetical protein